MWGCRQDKFLSHSCSCAAGTVRRNGELTSWVLQEIVFLWGSQELPWIICSQVTECIRVFWGLTPRKTMKHFYLGKKNKRIRWWFCPWVSVTWHQPHFLHVPCRTVGSPTPCLIADLVLPTLFSSPNKPLTFSEGQNPGQIFSHKPQMVFSTSIDPQTMCYYSRGAEGVWQDWVCSSARKLGAEILQYAFKPDSENRSLFPELGHSPGTRGKK